MSICQAMSRARRPVGAAEKEVFIGECETGNGDYFQIMDFTDARRIHCRITFAPLNRGVHLSAERAKMDITREQILEANPLLPYLEKQGVKLRGSGDQLKGTRCPTVQHRKDHWCVSVKVSEEIFRCNDCEHGGSIIDWIAIESGRDPKVVYKELADKISVTLNGSQRKQIPVKRSNDPVVQPSPGKGKIVQTYDYTDERGRLVYQCVRFDPKDFRQRRPDDKGGWIWNMEGQTRYLYGIQDVLNASEVAIVEGEKDRNNLKALGFTATCNVGGAGKWLSAYSECLADKDVIIFPDNDKPGREHAESIVESLSSKAASIKVVVVPTGKDVSDFIATFAKPEDATRALRDLIGKMPHTLKPLPIYTMKELEEQYTKFVTNIASSSFNLNKLLPSLGASIRKLVPGELVVIIADTSTGKTILMQTMAKAAKPLPTLFFELELPSELMFERFVQMQTNSTGDEVENAYREDPTPRWTGFNDVNHILVCPESGLTVDQMESYVHRSELKFGMKPLLVFVDYIGLVSSTNARSRYEKVSDAAEQMKVMAKRTGTIVIMASQVGRPDKKKERTEIRLHDARDSGSIEASAQLAIGMWRTDDDTLVLRILKNTKGKTGMTIECNFDGARMKITERAKQSNSEAPYKE